MIQRPQLFDLASEHIIADRDAAPCNAFAVQPGGFVSISWAAVHARSTKQEIVEMVVAALRSLAWWCRARGLRVAGFTQHDGPSFANTATTVRARAEELPPSIGWDDLGAPCAEWPR